MKRTKRIRTWLIVALAACVGVFAIFALSGADWTAYLSLWPAAIIVVFLVRSFTAPADARDAAAGVMTTYNNLYLARPDVEPDLLPPHTTHELFAPPDPLSEGKITLEHNGSPDTKPAL